MSVLQGGGPELCSGSVFAEGLVHLMSESHLPMEFPFDNKRRHYCAAHGAMGGLCDVHDSDPLPPPKPAPVALQAALAHVPIVVTAGARHQYLYHTLTTLLAAPGALHHNILVVLGDAPPSTTSLLHLLNLNFTSVAVSGRDNDKLFRYYRAVFRLLERSFPDAPAAILLDEDVEVSPDFFSFFSQTLWLLHADPSLYCINAYSHLLTLERGRGEQFVRRGAVQVSWGYAVTLHFVREAVRRWPRTAQGEDILNYDYWLYNTVRGKRECIFPEVSRLRHYGVGTNTSPFPHEYEAWQRPLLHASHVPLLNTPLVLQTPHETHFLSDLKAALPVSAGAPCNDNFPLVASTSRHSLVAYFVQEQEEDDDITSWYELAQCTGLHAASNQGHHAGVHLAFYPRQPLPRPPPQHPLNIYGFNYYIPGHFEVGEANFTRVYLMGVPYSRYSSLRPDAAELFDVRQLSRNRTAALHSKYTDSYSILLYNTTTHNYHTLIKQLFTPSRHQPLR
uniref:Alpha-1,3-mannosyl-glycoprotein 2-beta-N-acetylglucosaminyltransferase n=1 Tax=Scylla olivacea TaxID=85551 RepID=A0A0P4W1T5_SCYOL